jgi:hypothetical protein
MIGPTDLLHHFPATHFKTFQLRRFYAGLEDIGLYRNKIVISSQNIRKSFLNVHGASFVSRCFYLVLLTYQEMSVADIENLQHVFVPYLSEHFIIYIFFSHTYVQHLDYYQIFFIHQLMHKRIALKNIKIYIKTSSDMFRFNYHHQGAY